MCQEKKEEKELPTLKITSLHQHKDSKENTHYSIQKQLRKHKDKRGNNKKETETERKTTLWLFQSSKLVKSHSRRLGHDYRKNINRETKSLLIREQTTPQGRITLMRK